jgi:hypothetical protein
VRWLRRPQLWAALLVPFVIGALALLAGSFDAALAPTGSSCRPDAGPC